MLRLKIIEIWKCIYLQDTALDPHLAKKDTLRRWRPWQSKGGSAQLWERKKKRHLRQGSLLQACWTYWTRQFSSCPGSKGIQNLVKFRWANQLQPNMLGQIHLNSRYWKFSFCVYLYVTAWYFPRRMVIEHLDNIKEAPVQRVNRGRYNSLGCQLM